MADTKGEIVSKLLDLGGSDMGRRRDALTAGWRGAVVRALGLGVEDFQLVTGALEAGWTGTDAGIAALADQLPPGTEAAEVAPAGRSERVYSASYRRLVNALLPETESGLRGYLGADYPGWVAFRNAARPEIPQRLVFGGWARRHLPRARLRRAGLLFEHSAQDAVSLARDAFGQMQFRTTRIGAGGSVRHLPGYGPGADALRPALFPLHGAMLRFDSDAMRGTSPGGLRAGTARTGVRATHGPDGTPADLLDRRIAAARMLVTGRIGARGVVAVAPDGWYDPALVARALRSGDCREVWDEWSATGRWCSFFGPGGAMSRHTTHLVLVSGVDVTLSCQGRFDAQEQALLCARLGLRVGTPGRLGAGTGGAGGIWPFTLAQGASDMTACLNFDDRGTLHLDLRLADGRVQCWGRRVGGVAEAS